MSNSEPRFLGLNTLEEAMNVPPLDEGSQEYEMERGEHYSVSPLYDVDENGSLLLAKKSLWLHTRSQWSWNFFTYSSDCWAWVTDSRNGGKRVKVDTLEAHLIHSACSYGIQTNKRKNSSDAHAFVRTSGIAVCKSAICAWACASESGFGNWCTKRWCG